MKKIELTTFWHANKLRFIHNRVVIVFFHPWVYWLVGACFAWAWKLWYFLNSIMQYLCLLNTKQQFFLFWQKKFCLFQPKKKMGTFLFFFSENSTKFATYFKILAKFSIWQNWKGEKKKKKKPLLNNLLNFWAFSYSHLYFPIDIIILRCLVEHSINILIPFNWIWI